MTTTNKTRKKYDVIRAQAIKNAASKFDCTPDNVRKVIAGTREDEELNRWYRNEYVRIQQAMKPVNA